MLFRTDHRALSDQHYFDSSLGTNLSPLQHGLLYPSSIFGALHLYNDSYNKSLPVLYLAFSLRIAMNSTYTQQTIIRSDYSDQNWLISMAIYVIHVKLAADYIQYKSGSISAVIEVHQTSQQRRPKKLEIGNLN